MKLFQALWAAAAFTLAMIAASANAQAATCNDVVSCLDWTNTNIGSGISGNTSNSSGTGVYGSASGGAQSRAVFGINTGNGQAVAGTSVSGVGVFGTTGGAWPAVGVYGTTSAVNTTAIAGISAFANTTGVYGQGTAIGVQGFSTGTNAWGTSGVANGSGSHAIDAICNGSCATSSNGLAGNFSGNVTIIGKNSSGGLTITVGTGAKPGGGTWASTSDQRVKRDVKPFALGLPELERVRPVTFKYNGLGGTEDNGVDYVGVIAQELEKIAPAMVSSKRAKLRKSDAVETDIKQVDSTAFTFMLINAVKEQQRVIARQEARLAVLERSHSPLMSSSLSGGLGKGLALGLLPLGLIFAIGRRRNKAS